VERHAGEILAQPSELAVLGPEIVAPLADAMRFVDGDEPDASGDTYSRRQRSSRTLASTPSRSCGSSVLFRYDADTPSTRRPST
jgi:hypothetical protein